MFLEKNKERVGNKNKKCISDKVCQVWLIPNPTLTINQSNYLDLNLTMYLMWYEFNKDGTIQEKDRVDPKI